jgi:hypothetical protein
MKPATASADKGAFSVRKSFLNSPFSPEKPPFYSDVQKSVPVKLARLLVDITIRCCFDSHPRIDSFLQNSGFRYGLLENAIGALATQFY